MSCAVHLAVPPNVARGLRSRLAERFPGVQLGTPDIHQEMYEFALHCGPTPPPGFAVSAYPQLARNILEHPGAFAVPDADMPDLRPELRDLGMTPPRPELCIVAVVPCVLALNEHLAAGVGDWCDLVAQNFQGPLGTPPRDTPLPYLAEEYLGGDVRLDTASTPQDINRRVSGGELAAGLLIPAFGRVFREEGSRMLWPASGALAVPLVACIGGDAPKEAHEILAYLLSKEIQEFFSSSGGLVPVRADVAGFPELEDSRWRLLWLGWDALLRVAAAMDRTLEPVPGDPRPL